MRKVLIKDVGKVITGNTPSKKNPKFYDSDDIGFVKPDGIAATGITSISNTKEYISENARKKARVVQKGTVLVTCIGNIGKMGVVENEEMAFNQQINAISPNDSVLSKYLAYNILSNKKKLEAISNAPVVPIINKTQFENFEITIHEEINVQEKIVSILDKLTCIIEKKNKQLEEYDHLIKSRFVEMFGDVGLYPSKAFKECTNFIDYRGKTPKLSDDGTIRMINAKSVGKGLFKVVDEYVTEEVYDEWMKRGFPKGGDILFVTEGHTFGNVCRIPEDMTKFALGQRVITIQGNTGILDNIYLETYMQFRDFKSDIDRYKTGSSAQGIRSKELIKINIPLPDYNLQLEFANIVRNIDKLKFKEKDYCLKYKNIMIDILKGEDHVLQL